MSGTMASVCLTRMRLVREIRERADALAMTKDRGVPWEFAFDLRDAIARLQDILPAETAAESREKDVQPQAD